MKAYPLHSYLPSPGYFKCAAQFHHSHFSLTKHSFQFLTVEIEVVSLYYPLVDIYLGYTVLTRPMCILKVPLSNTFGELAVELSAVFFS
jgi:hypothetical protein